MGMETANEIRRQIKVGDVWALGAWGAREFVGYPEGDEGMNGAYILGGLRFRVKTPRYSRGCIVCIYLMGDDTYSIRVCRCIGTTVTELAFVEGVYCDQLVQVIDGLIENKEGRRAA